MTANCARATSKKAQPPRSGRLRAVKLGQCRTWPALVHHGPRAYRGRLVAVKRSRWSACLERRALRKRAAKRQKRLSRAALFLAPELWPAIRRHGLEIAIAMNGMPDPVFARGLNNPRYQEEVIFRTRQAIDQCADAGRQA